MMKKKAVSALYPINCYSSKEKVHLTNYADLIITDKEKNLIGCRFGGYPESVVAMTDAVMFGSDVFAKIGSNSTDITNRKIRNYSRKTTRDGIYAESVLFQKDSDIKDKSEEESENNGGNGQEKEKTIRCMYIYCKTPAESELFAELDKKLSVPLIPEFADYLIKSLYKSNLLEQLEVQSVKEEIYAYRLIVKGDESDVAEILEEGLKKGRIRIPNANKGSSIFDNITGFTDYLCQFGLLIAERIKKSFVPLFDPENEKICDKLTDVNAYIAENAGYELFDAQLASAEGLKRELDKAKLALLVAECGSGKTKIGAAALSARQKNPGFNVIICPSHVCDKWVRELDETIPNSFSAVMDSFQDLGKMQRIHEKSGRSVWCVISKEKARDGYMKEPAVVWSNVKSAFICPDCDAIQEMPYFEDGEKHMVNADHFFYKRENSLNHKCGSCGTVVWSVLNPNCLNPKLLNIKYFHKIYIDSNIVNPSL
jgi:hypothetical protein